MAERDIAEKVDTTVRGGGWFAHVVRVGLIAYGVVHLLLAWVAVRLLFVHHAGTATSEGALAQLARDAWGRWTLATISAAFLALVAWQLVAMAVGYRQETGMKRHVMRVGAGGRAVVYGYFAWASAKFAVNGSSSKGRSPHSMTAQILDAPAGPLLLGVLACIVAGTGIALAVFGWRRQFLSQLDSAARHGDRRIPIALIGQVGYVVKGLAFVAIGALLVWAAIAHDPKKSGGLDQALYQLLGNTLGKIAVVVIGAGIGCFGLYLFVRARHLDTDNLTS
jgi:hypothetical protein